MKRGFLNTSKAKKVLSQGSTATATSGLDSLSGGGPGIPDLSSEAERLAMKAYFRNVPEIYHKPMPLVASKIPGPNYSSPPDGHTIWLAYKPTLERILGSSPVFKPIPKPKYSKAPFAVKASANKGLGLFATRNIGAGELLFTERPLLVVPSSNAGIAVTHYARVKDLDVEDQLKFGVEEWETHLQRAVNAMLPENKEEFMKLANQHTQDGSGPIFGIVRTNGYGIGPEFYDGDKVLPHQTNTYSAIAKLGSRINHSCTPNVHYDFSISSFSFEFKTLSDIKAGEELLLTYVETAAPVAERRAPLLANYGFVCHCRVCDHATPQSDRLRQTYVGLVEQYANTLNWQGHGSPKESEIEPVVKLQKAMLKEGLSYTGEYITTISMLQSFYQAIGMEAKARPFLAEIKKYALAHGYL